MKTLASLLVLIWAARLSAQVPITESGLTPEAAARVVAFYNRQETTRLTGDTRIAAGTELGNAALLEGVLTLAGHVRGDLAIVNGDMVVEPGAVIDGTLTLVGGVVRGVANLSATHVVWYRDRMKYELRNGVLVLMHETRGGELSAGRQFGFGRTDLLVAARGGYNRSEGLPVYIGPRLTLGRSNPTVVEGLFIFRTAAAFRFDDHDYGFAVRLEQFVGGKRAARLGVRFANEVLPIETSGLSDRENSLATFVVHRDYRDHYNRAGWAAYVKGGRSGLPLEWTLEYGNQRFENAALRDPYSLLHNPDTWRPEVVIPDVELRLFGTRLQYDTRNDDRDPSTGWLVRAGTEFALDVRSGLATEFAGDYRHGLLDVRRYVRFTPNARLSLRGVAGGSINGDALPSFRQHALGGEGSLPGYRLHQLDCGGHQNTTQESGRSAYYGCDRLALFQVEYQSNFPWLSRIGRSVGRDFGVLENIRWILFFDTGRTWTEPEAAGPRATGAPDFVADAGFGLRFGPLGAYWAVPLSARAQGLNFFARLGPRL